MHDTTVRRAEALQGLSGTMPCRFFYIQNTYETLLEDFIAVYGLASEFDENHANEVVEAMDRVLNHHA
ncbi:hypothetical protein H310_11110 [Aphanomyces invadans]|nr:hypothetical protein H310_11110 [Aphanomyces invadans]ETV95694.1 hypothetical protein H310_11110 [Aphanomyces invadans]|eukprot:XP_008875887.1 hypothetical protein H310_11110 [Aphanomyces invadans]